MKPLVFAAEYELPTEIRTGRKRAWFVALAITAVVIGAGIAASGELPVSAVG